MSLSSTTKAGGDDVTSINNNNQRKDIIVLGGDYAVATGSGGAFVLTIDGQITSSLPTNILVKFKANHTIQNAATLNVNTIGAVSIKRIDGSATEPGDIVNGQMVACLYDGTNFYMLTKASSEAHGQFGDHSDGDITYSSNTSLSGHVYADVITINTGVSVNTNGYAVHARMIVQNGTGKFTFNGNNGSSGGTGQIWPGAAASGGAGGAAPGSGPFAGVAAPTGGAGAQGVSGNASGLGSPNPTVGTNKDKCLGPNAVAGAQGGSGGSPSGGGGAAGAAAGSKTNAIVMDPSKHWMRAMKLEEEGLFYHSSPGNGASSGGGSGGGSTSTNCQSGGGGGAGGGGSTPGLMPIFAQHIISTGNTLFESTGGNGGNGGDGGPAAANTGGAGGGGGGAGGPAGNGGTILVVYQTTTDTISSISDVSAGSVGTGGNGGAGAGTGSAGQAGANGTAGNAGTIIDLQVN